MSSSNSAVVAGSIVTSFSSGGGGVFAVFQSEMISALNADPKLVYSLYGRGLAKHLKGDKAGGDADMAAAVQAMPDIADQFAKLGVKDEVSGSYGTAILIAAGIGVLAVIGFVGYYLGRRRSPPPAAAG